jgi:hemolysin activation/secretion protein
MPKKNPNYPLLILPIIGAFLPLSTKAITPDNLMEHGIDGSPFRFENKQQITAQVPRVITPRQPELPPPTLPPEQQPPVIETPPPIQPTEPRLDISSVVQVAEFRLVGNTAFSEEELNKIVEPFIGKKITFTELLQAEQAITNLYVQAGYINSSAVIPAGQSFDPNAAVITINIVEGRIGKIEVTGTKRLKPNYISSRLALASKAPFNQEKLLKALQLLQLNPLIKNISAELSPTPDPEVSLLTVTVNEGDSNRISPFMDNGKTPSVGSFERGVNLEDINLLGLGDTISLTYTNSDGSNAFDGSYTIPFNARNGTLKIAGGFNNTTVIEYPFEDLDITGDSNYFELTVRQPVVESPTQELAFGLIGSLETSQTGLLGKDFPLSLGANDDGETKLTVLRLFQDWTKRNPKDVFSLRSQFNLGINAFGATINESPLPDGTFFSWRSQAQYVRLLAPDTLLVVRGDIQLAPQTLVPLEQIAIGGLGSVRGYRQDLLLTDNGVFLSLEARIPILRADSIGGILLLAPFIDFGSGWNSDDLPNPDPSTIIGTGLGLQWQIGDKLNARFDWGIPLIDANTEERTWNEHGLYFSINANL